MKIVLAFDGSAGSEAALEEVVLRPWPKDTRFEVLTVADTLSLGETPQLIEEVERLARVTVNAATKHLMAAGLSAVGCLISGDPRTAILTHVTDGAADWVFAGAHATGLPFMLGSVAKALLQGAPCPVSIIRASEWRKDDQPGKRIVLATDGSELSDAAVRAVQQRSWPDGTEVHLFSSVELTTTLAQAFEPPFLATDVMQQAREAAMLRAQSAIATAREILAAQNLVLSESISVLFEKPAQAILDEAERWGADLIVIGSHGRKGWNRWWLGSVSEAVAVHAKCSVEVIRPRTTKPLLDTRA